MSQRKKWSASAKFEIAIQAIKGDATLNEICKRYSVAPTQVHAWKKQLLEQGSNVFAKHDKTTESAVSDLERKQSRLYEKIGQLTVEKDFLKKSWERLPENGDDS
jgi:transposase